MATEVTHQLKRFAEKQEDRRKHNEKCDWDKKIREINNTAAKTNITTRLTNKPIWDGMPAHKNYAKEARLKRGRSVHRLASAAANGDETTLRSLLDVGLDINSTAHAGAPPLHYACANGHEAVVLLLIENGALVNTKDEKFGVTALHQAAARDHHRIVALLLENGADPLATSKFGVSVLETRSPDPGRPRDFTQDGFGVDVENEHLPYPFTQLASEKGPTAEALLLEAGSEPPLNEAGAAGFRRRNFDCQQVRRDMPMAGVGTGIKHCMTATSMCSSGIEGGGQLVEGSRWVDGAWAADLRNEMVMQEKTKVRRRQREERRRKKAEGGGEEEEEGDEVGGDEEALQWAEDASSMSGTTRSASLRQHGSAMLPLAVLTAAQVGLLLCAVGVGKVTQMRLEEDEELDGATLCHCDEADVLGLLRGTRGSGGREGSRRGGSGGRERSGRGGSGGRERSGRGGMGRGRRRSGSGSRRKSGDRGEIGKGGGSKGPATHTRRGEERPSEGERSRGGERPSEGERSRGGERPVLSMTEKRGREKRTKVDIGVNGHEREREMGQRRSGAAGGNERAQERTQERTQEETKVLRAVERWRRHGVEWTCESASGWSSRDRGCGSGGNSGGRGDRSSARRRYLAAVAYEEQLMRAYGRKKTAPLARNASSRAL
jgi:ankyrin repeat protein